VEKKEKRRRRSLGSLAAPLSAAWPTQLLEFPSWTPRSPSSVWEFFESR
jgi:hypothetical protein